MDSSKRDLLRSVPAATAAALFASTSTSASAAAVAEKPPLRTRKIALEEHFMFPEFIGYFDINKANITPDLIGKAMPVLTDFGDRRLAAMDANGIDYVVLSLSGPGVQAERDTATAVRLARKCNDDLAKQTQARPTRYGGFAHLAMQDPRAAADELERCMKDLKFKGALINGQTNGVYLDDRRYDVFWERASALQAPVYIHPGNSADHPAMYAEHPELWGPTWSWAAETCSHALRLVFSGTFDRYPNAKVILGHMGETLPIQLWRLDSRYPISNHRYTIAKKPSDYIRSNIAITTAGVCSDAALRCAIDALGIDNVMFSVDFPFENTKIASEWISAAKVSDAERAKICHANATRILRL